MPVVGTLAGMRITESDGVSDRATLLEQMGGPSGLVYSSAPVSAFIPVDAFWGLTAAIWSSLGVAAMILGWRLIRRGPVQPAISGFVGVGICVFTAHHTGSAKGYFLYGIWVSLLLCLGFGVSIPVRWPMVGVLWGVLEGHGTGWRSNRVALRAYDLATAVWTLVFAARYVVQQHLYHDNRTGLLAAARIGMGWPLTGVALLVTIWAVRRAGHRRTAV